MFSESLNRWLSLCCAASLLLVACSDDPSSSTDSSTSTAAMSTTAGGSGSATNITSSASTAGTSGAAQTTGATNTGRAGTSASPPSAAAAAASATAATAPPSSTVAAGSGATTGSAGALASAGGAAASAGAGGSPGSASSTAVACDPANKKPDPTAASYQQIKGYESLTKEPTTGPNKPVLENDPGLADWTVYRPDKLESETKHAILVWANGGCLTNGTLYGQWLLEVASYGFIAIADGKPQPANADPAAGGQRGFGADGKPQQMAIDWIVAENDRPCSQYYQKLDTTKIAVAGQSCGGLMALGAAGDKRVTTALIFNSGLLSPDQTVYTPLHTPIGYFIGGMTDSAYANANSDFSEIKNIPLFLGNLDVGHGATWEETNAGEFGRVGLGWLKWQLLGDSAAAMMFKGADCELCKPPSKWVVQKKMLD